MKMLSCKQPPSLHPVSFCPLFPTIIRFHGYSLISSPVCVQVVSMCIYSLPFVQLSGVHGVSLLCCLIVLEYLLLFILIKVLPYFYLHRLLIFLVGIYCLQAWPIQILLNFWILSKAVVKIHLLKTFPWCTLQCHFLNQSFC